MDDYTEPKDSKKMLSGLKSTLGVMAFTDEEEEEEDDHYSEPYHHVPGTWKQHGSEWMKLAVVQQSLILD